MSSEEIRVIIVVYLAVFLPLFIYFKNKSKLPIWIPSFYMIAVVVCALGWELWFTYGWIDGVVVVYGWVNEVAVGDGWILDDRSVADGWMDGVTKGGKATGYLGCFGGSELAPFVLLPPLPP